MVSRAHVIQLLTLIVLLPGCLVCSAVNIWINVSINYYNKPLTQSTNSDVFLTFIIYFCNGVGLLVVSIINLSIRNEKKFDNWGSDGTNNELEGISKKKFSKAENTKTSKPKEEYPSQEAIKYFTEDKNACFHLFQPGLFGIYFHHLVVTKIRIVVDTDDQRRGANSEHSKKDLMFEYTDYDGHKVDIKDVLMYRNGEQVPIADLEESSCKNCCFICWRGVLYSWSCPIAGLVTDGNRVLLSKLLHSDLYVRKIIKDETGIQTIRNRINSSIGELAYDAAYNNCEHYAHKVVDGTHESKQITMGTYASYYILNAFGPFAKVNTSRKLFAYFTKFFLYFLAVILISILVNEAEDNDPKMYYIFTLALSLIFEISHIAFELHFFYRSKGPFKRCSDGPFKCCFAWLPIILKLILSSWVMIIAVNGGAMLGNLIFTDLPLFIGEFIMSSFCCVVAAIFFSPLSTVYVDFTVFSAYKKFWGRVVYSSLFVIASFAILGLASAVILDGMFIIIDCDGLCPWAISLIPYMSFLFAAFTTLTNSFALISVCRNYCREREDSSSLSPS